MDANLQVKLNDKSLLQAASLNFPYVNIDNKLNLRAHFDDLTINFNRPNVITTALNCQKSIYCMLHEQRLSVPSEKTKIWRKYPANQYLIVTDLAKFYFVIA